MISESSANSLPLNLAMSLNAWLHSAYIPLEYKYLGDSITQMTIIVDMRLTIVPIMTSGFQDVLMNMK